MDPENIDWENIESVFVEDDMYENFRAPKWVDLTDPDSLLTDDEAWFCNSKCKHPKTVENLSKPTRDSKVKLLRSLSISEILPFRERNQRDVKPKSQKPKGFNFPGKIEENSENKNPNISPSIPISQSKMKKKNKQEEIPPENWSKSGRLPRLKSAFSARDLLGGREILNQISELCSDIKKLARNGSKKVSSGGVLDELKQRIRDRERKPLIVRQEK